MIRPSTYTVDTLSNPHPLMDTKLAWEAPPYPGGHDRNSRLWYGAFKDGRGVTGAQVLANLSAAFNGRCASRAVQFHPHGGQFVFVWLSARTMHPHGAYVW